MSHFTVAVFSRDPDDVDVLLAPFEEDVKPNSEYAEFIEDDDFSFDEAAGKNGYWCNPEAKWDWYSTGGRWDGLLKLKDGTTTNSAWLSDCVFERDEEAYKRALRFWEVVVDGSPLLPGEKKEDFDSFWKPEYYSERYGNKETYASGCADFNTYAFLTADGEWHEPGAMGWFGCSDATANTQAIYDKDFQNYLASARQQNLYLTIVDCHI